MRSPKLFCSLLLTCFSISVATLLRNVFIAAILASSYVPASKFMFKTCCTIALLQALWQVCHFLRCLFLFCRERTSSTGWPQALTCCRLPCSTRTSASGRRDLTLARSKQATLEELQKKMAALYASSFIADVPVFQAYEIYCSAFREYLLKHYATSTHDLRVYPLDDVAPDSLLMRQAVSIGRQVGFCQANAVQLALPVTHRCWPLIT